MESFYQAILSYISSRERLKNPIISIAKYSPYILYLLYPLLILYLIFIHHPLTFVTIIKPLSAFIFVTILRKLINRPRPHMSMNVDPLIKHKDDQSFPSRHALSAFIISLVCFNISFYLGIVTMIIAAIIGLSRIVTGVHFISDVITAFIIAFIFYII